MTTGLLSRHFNSSELCVNIFQLHLFVFAPQLLRLKNISKNHILHSMEASFIVHSGLRTNPAFFFQLPDLQVSINDSPTKCVTYAFDIERSSSGRFQARISHMTRLKMSTYNITNEHWEWPSFLTNRSLALIMFEIMTLFDISVFWEHKYYRLTLQMRVL